MSFVDDDVREFVAARWPDLEAVAHVVLLDAGAARAVTTATLVGLVRDWEGALEDGRPGERARRLLLGASLAASGRAPVPGDRPDEAQPEVPSAVPWEDPGVDPVLAALVAAVRAAPPLERAVLAAAEVWDVDPDEVAHLLDRPSSTVHEAAASLRRRLAAAQDRGRADAGMEPARWSLGRDTADAVTRLLQDLDEPPDPAGLVAEVAHRVRRRSVVVGATAAVGLAAGAVAVGSTLRPPPATDPAEGPPPPAGDPTWASTRTWVARGRLGRDPALVAMVAASDEGARILWADEIEGRRVVIARRDLSREGSTTVRVWSGPRGATATALREVPLRVEEIDDAEDAVAVALPTAGGTSGLLVLLSRPQVLRCMYSPLVTYTAAGGVRREWREVGLIDGLSTVRLRQAPSPALRVRLGPYDGPPAGPQRVTIGTTRSAETDPSAAVAAAAGPFVAAAAGLPPDSVTSEVVFDGPIPGDVLAPWVAVARPGVGRVLVVHSRTPDGALLRTVRVHDDGRSRVGSADLESARPIAVEDAVRPFATRLPPMRSEVGRFLVVAPGMPRAAKAQLLAITASSYPVSEVTPIEDGAGVLEVVDARLAAVYRLVLWDAAGTRLGAWRQLLGRRDPNDMWPRFG